MNSTTASSSASHDGEARAQPGSSSSSSSSPSLSSSSSPSLSLRAVETMHPHAPNQLQPQHQADEVSHGAQVSQRHPGGYLPSHDKLEHWLDGFHERAQLSHSSHVKWHPVVLEFQQLLEREPLLRLHVTSMIDQTPRHKPYKTRHIRSVHQLLKAINHILGTAPRFDKTELVGTPLNAVLDFMMDTPAGFAAFRDATINAMLRKILMAWCDFLCSPASVSALHTGPSGWMCPEAVAHLNMQEVEHDPQHPHWGFKSWNDFFTRRFRAGMRPVASADDHKVIVSACESTPYNIAFNAQLEAKFWLKKQPYSLRDMMGNDERAAQFIGGTVYQAFLSATFYHRWHAPVSGTVQSVRLIPGTYFSEAESAGFDPAGPNNSQGYITHVAARALIFIQCDDAGIGLMALLFVGMAEVSSCVFSPHVKEGAHLRKGEEIGYFQYGGSTHCCIFRKDVIHSFTAHAIPTGEFGAESAGPAVKLSQQIALAN